MSSIPYKIERTPFGEKRGSSSENVLPTTPPRKQSKRRSTIVAKHASQTLPAYSPSPPKKRASTSTRSVRHSKSTPSLVDPPREPLPPLPPGAASAVDPRVVFEKERFLNRHSKDFGYLHEALVSQRLEADEAEAQAERERIERLRLEGREKRRSLVLHGGIPGLTSPTSPEVGQLPTMTHRRRRPLSLVGSSSSIDYTTAFGDSNRGSGSSSAPPHLRQFSLSSQSSQAYMTAPEEYLRTPKASRRPLSLISLTPPRSRTSGISASSDNTTSRGGCSDFSGESSELRAAAQYMSSAQATTEEEQEMMRRRAIAIARTSRRLGGVSHTNGDGRNWEDSGVNERAKSLYHRQSDDLGLGLGALPESSQSAQDAYENPRRYNYTHRREPSTGSYPLGANNTSGRKRYSQVRREADARRSDALSIETYRSSGSSASIATSGGIARGRELLLVAAAGLKEQYVTTAMAERQEFISPLPSAKLAHPRGPLRDAKSSEASTASVPFSVDGPSPERPWALAQSSGANARTLRRVKRLDDQVDNHGIRISLFSSGSEASHAGPSGLAALGMDGLQEEDVEADVTTSSRQTLSPLSPPESQQSSSPGSDETEVWRGMSSVEMGRRLFWGGGEVNEERTHAISRVNTLRKVNNEVGLGLGITSSSSFTAAIASSASIAQAAAASNKQSLLASPLLDTPPRSPIAPAPLGTTVYDGTNGASPGRPVRQTAGWTEGVKGWLRGTKEKEAGEGEIERGFGDGRAGEEGEKTPPSTKKKRQKGWKSFVGADHDRDGLSLSPNSKRRSSVPDRIPMWNSSASASTVTVQSLPTGARRVSSPESSNLATLTPPPVPHLPTPYSPSSASSSSPLTPRFVEANLPRSQILHQPSATSMRSMSPFVPPSISSPSQFAVHFAGGHSYSHIGQTPGMASQHIHSPNAPDWTDIDREQATNGQVLTLDNGEVRVPRMSPPPLGKRSKQSLEPASLDAPPRASQDRVRVHRLAAPSSSFVGIGHRNSFAKYDFLKEDPQTFSAQTLPKAKLRGLPTPMYLDPRASSSLPASPNPDFDSDFGTPPVSASHSGLFAEQQSLIPPSILRRRITDSIDVTPDIRPAMAIRTASQESVASSRSSIVDAVESLEQIIPATVLFILGFFLGPCE